MKYRALAVAILVLAPLLFWFLYSELGQYTIEKERPAAQDYCEIVNATKAETGKDALSDLFKLKVEKSFCYPNIDEPRIHHTLYNQLETEHFHLPRKSSKIYLFNNTFLI
ncbi:MAG: hypothetical protein ABIG69_07600 [Bacteroidota bacterium]